MDRKQSDPRELLLMIFNVSLKNRSQATGERGAIGG